MKRRIWFLATAMLLVAAAGRAITETDVQAPLVSDVGAVPEPGILALVGMGLAVVAILLRRKKGA